LGPNAANASAQRGKTTIIPFFALQRNISQPHAGPSAQIKKRLYNNGL
jgi:hypothetical protein